MTYCPKCGETNSSAMIFSFEGKMTCSSCGWQEGTGQNSPKDMAGRKELIKNGMWEKWKA